MFSFGFYDSLNGDRKYTAEQMSSIFDGVICDGVYQNVGDFLTTVVGTGMQVIVKTGRAWFNHTWSLNDSLLPLVISEADIVRTRIDAVVLEVDARLESRTNSIKIVEGTPNTNPIKPPLQRDAGVYQYPLAYVTVNPNATAITEADIEIMVGREDTPFVTCPLTTVPIDDLFNKWNGEFNAWFENIKEQLSGDIVANLQKQIDERVKIADKATAEDLADGTEGKWVDAKLAKDNVMSITQGLEVGDIVYSTRNLEELTDGKLIACDQRILIKDAYPTLFEKAPALNSRLVEPVFVSDTEKYINSSGTESAINGTMFTLFLTAPTYGEYTLLYYSSMGLMRKKKNSSDPYELWYLPKTASGSTVSLSTNSTIAIVGEYIYYQSSNTFVIYRGEEYVSTYTISAPGTSATAPLGIQVKDDIIVYCFYRSTGLIAVSFAQGALLKDTIINEHANNTWASGRIRLNNNILMQDDGVIYIASYYYPYVSSSSNIVFNASVTYTRDGVNWNTVTATPSVAVSMGASAYTYGGAFARYVDEKFVVFILAYHRYNNGSSTVHYYIPWLFSIAEDGEVNEIWAPEKYTAGSDFSNLVYEVGALSNDREFIVVSKKQPRNNVWRADLCRIGYDGSFSTDQYPIFLAGGHSSFPSEWFNLLVIGDTFCISRAETYLSESVMDSRVPTYTYETGVYNIAIDISSSSYQIEFDAGSLGESYDGKHHIVLPIYMFYKSIETTEDDEYYYFTGIIDGGTTTVRHAKIPKNQRRMFYGKNQYMKISD